MFKNNLKQRLIFKKGNSIMILKKNIMKNSIDIFKFNDINLSTKKHCKGIFLWPKHFSISFLKILKIILKMLNFGR